MPSFLRLTTYHLGHTCLPAHNERSVGGGIWSSTHVFCVQMPLCHSRNLSDEVFGCNNMYQNVNTNPIKILNNPRTQITSNKVIKIYFVSTAFFDSEAGRLKRAATPASLPAQRQLHRNCTKLHQPTLRRSSPTMFSPQNSSRILLSNTPLQHFPTTLLPNTLSSTSQQHSAPTLLYNTSLQQSSPTLLSNTCLQHFSTTLFSNTSLQHTSPTLLYKALLRHSSPTHLYNSLRQHSSPTLVSNTSLHLSQKLLYDTARQHFSPTLLCNTSVQLFSATPSPTLLYILFSKTLFQLSSTTLLYNTPFQHFSPTLLYNGSFHWNRTNAFGLWSFAMAPACS